MATYVGYKKKGLIGSIVSTLGVIIPSFIIILIIAKSVSALGDKGVMMGAMAGLRASALGLVVVAMIQLFPAAIKSKWALLAAVLAFVLITILHINTAYVILLFAVLGVAVTMFVGRRAVAEAADAVGEHPEDGLLSDKDEGGESE